MAIKKAREAKGWTQEYLAQLVDLTPRSIMYIENRGQHPRLNKFFHITTLLGISVDQFFIHAMKLKKAIAVSKLMYCLMEWKKRSLS